MNSDRQIRSFSLPVVGVPNIINIGFHDNDADPTNDWRVTVENGAITWQTDTYAVNPGANALVFGYMFNFRFDASAAPELYRGPAWPRPATPWMRRFYLGDPADTLPDYVPLAQPATGYLGPITVSLDPGRLGRPYLMRSDLAVLQIIKDELGKRPIYFSTSTGNYPDQLGLSPYLVGEGLVRRVVPGPVGANANVRLLEGRGFVNVPRSTALLFGVYRGGETAARPRPRGWIDVPSQNSLLGYVFAYDTIAAALRESDPTRAARAVALRDAILANTTYAPAGGRGLDN